MGHRKGCPKRKVYSHEYIHKKDRNISNKQLNAKSQTPSKTEQEKPKSRRRREIIKIRANIKEREAKRPYKKSIKQKAGSLKNE
jgi:hypothetical protein